MSRAPPRRKKKFSSKDFVLDEAEHSGDEEGDEYNEVYGEDQYDFGDPFLDDGPIVPVHDIADPLDIIDNFPAQIEYPPSPSAMQIVPIKPAPAAPKGPPPPPPPPPANGAAPPPPAKPPAKKPASDWIRPKTDKDKRMCQIVQQGLMPAVQVGYLTHVLITVIPDPHEKLEDAWSRVQERRQILTELAKSLKGLFCFFIATETHGAAADKKPKKRKNPNAQDAAHQAEQRGDNAEEPDRAPAKKDTLAGKPHFHLLLYYPRLAPDVINLSHLKHLVMSRLPLSDVNEIHLPRRHSDADFVRACTYVMKGVNCRATRTYWQKHVNPGTAPPLPQFYPGTAFGYDPDKAELAKEESKRFTKMLALLTPYCESFVPIELGEAPPVFSRPIKRSKASEASYTLAKVMEVMGIYVGGPEHDSFYEIEKRSDYVVQRTYIRRYNFTELKAKLTTNAAAREIVINHSESMRNWFVSVEYAHIPPVQYEWVELKDAYYHIRTGNYAPKDHDFAHMCFRSYHYTQHELETSLPHEWLRLVHLVTTPQLRPVTTRGTNGAQTAHFTHPPHREALLIALAKLLRQRTVKEPCLFLWGDSNCGKSSLISFLEKMYPKEAVGFLNKSCVSLSGINEGVAVIITDEFDVTSISRQDLLTLTDGTQRLTIRTMHDNARQIENPLCPIVFMNNKQPVYKDDTSRALENRFNMMRLENELVRDPRKQQACFAEHLLVVAYLNRYLKMQEELYEEHYLFGQN